MRAAIVIPGFYRLGGAERQAILLAKGLRRRGWNIAVVTLSDKDKNIREELHCAGIEYLNLEMRKGVADPRGWMRFLRWLAHWKPHVVHAHLPHATWLARWSRLGRSGYVLVDTLHSSCTGNLGRHIGYRISDWLAGTVTAVSQAVGQAHRSAALVSPRKLRILPNGVDTTALAPDIIVRGLIRAELGIKNNFLWIAAGRLVPVKDFPLLLRAMALLPATAHLLIAGEGNLRSELEALAIELQLANRVRFLGFVSDVIPYLQAADAAVLSSRWEGLPMMLLEAGSCGLPCVATDVAGSREVVEDGVTGLLTPPGNPQALANAMDRMMNAPLAFRQTMGLRARQKIVSSFDLESVLDRWERLYIEEMESLHEHPHAELKSTPVQTPDC